MYHYRVNFDSRTVSETRGKGDFADWSRTNSNSFESVEVAPANAYDAVKSNVNLVVSDGWLVWVETSSGDSFGSGTRTGTDAIGIFATKEAAMQCSERLEAHAADRSSSSSFSFASPDGNDVEIGYAPWSDYFGGLDEVHVQRVNLHEHGDQANRKESKITVHG